MIDQQLYQQGLDAFRAGDLARAEAVLRQLVAQFPQSSLADNALYQLGLTLSMTGRKAEALELFRQCARTYPESDAAPLAKDQARTLVDELEYDRSLEARKLFHRGQDLAAKGDLKGAKEALIECTEKYPDSLFADNAFLRLSTVLSMLGELKEARRVLLFIQENYPESDAARLVPSALQSLARSQDY